MKVMELTSFHLQTDRQTDRYANSIIALFSDRPVFTYYQDQLLKHYHILNQ